MTSPETLARTPEPELDRTLATFERAIFGAHADEDDLRALGSRERVLLYRDLVRSRLRDLVASALPRVTTLLGRPAIDRLVDQRLTAAPPTTRFFREVVLEIVDPVSPDLASLEIAAPHPHIDDLARLELAQWRAIWDDATTTADVVEFDFGKRPVVSPTMTRLELAWSVHQSDRPLTQAEAGSTFHVAVYRRRDHVVETRWMNGPLAAILDQWRVGELTAIDAVRTAMSGLGQEPTADVVDAMSGLLAELLERGGVLGSRAPRPSEG